MVWSRARVGARGAADFASLAVSVGQEAEAARSPVLGMLPQTQLSCLS